MMTRIFLVIGVTALVMGSVRPNYGAPGPKFTDPGGGNKHNLSYSNTNVNFKATNSTDMRAKQICIFCHTPHNARPQTTLWNRSDSTQSFGHYSSSSLSLHLDATARTASDYKAEPNGSSRLCLSCHDGVTALGAVLSGVPIEVNGSMFTKMTGDHVFDRAKITNSHHPVSFKYTAEVVARLKTLEGPVSDYWLPADAPSQESPGAPGTNKARQFVRLDKEKRMQCTTCHDPHQSQYHDTNTPPLTPFWAYDGRGLSTVNADTVHDEVCYACHSFKTPNP
ncbi:MAG TPA: cytochrome C [Geobacter sulfurreducens]|nr:cytochrome C [Geobacter sulfurreducens]